jgi:hypothetical protein
MRRSSTSSGRPVSAAGTLWVRVAAIVLITVPLAAQRTPATGVRAVASVKQLHEVMISPASDSITVACEACHRPYRDQGRQMGVPAR